MVNTRAAARRAHNGNSTTLGNLPESSYEDAYENNDYFQIVSSGPSSKATKTMTVADWERERENIRRKYLLRRHSQFSILHDLREKGWKVHERRLKRQLQKWGFRKINKVQDHGGIAKTQCVERTHRRGSGSLQQQVLTTAEDGQEVDPKEFYERAPTPSSATIPSSVITSSVTTPSSITPSSSAASPSLAATPSLTTPSLAGTPPLAGISSLAATPSLTTTQNCVNFCLSVNQGYGSPLIFTFSTAPPANIEQSTGAVQSGTNWQPTGPGFSIDAASCQPNQQSQLGPVEAGDFSDLGIGAELDLGGFSDLGVEGEQDFGGFGDCNEG